jgi:hypothetical protein
MYWVEDLTIAQGQRRCDSSLYRTFVSWRLHGKNAWSIWTPISPKFCKFVRNEGMVADNGCWYPQIHCRLPKLSDGTKSETSAREIDASAHDRSFHSTIPAVGNRSSYCILPETGRGNRWIVTAVDYATGCRLLNELPTLLRTLLPSSSSMRSICILVLHKRYSQMGEVMSGEKSLRLISRRFRLFTKAQVLIT